MPHKSVDKQDSDKEYRYWSRELQGCDRRMAKWRKRGEQIVKRYRAESRQENTFNILWANTETLDAAVYNSLPQPDVRRRFRDEDKIGKAVSEVLDRSLQVLIENESFDSSIRDDVLDSLLPGRGVSRIRYLPSLASLPPAKEVKDDDGLMQAPTAGEEVLEYEQVVLEHVDWKDFRHGYGRVWAEVQWVAYRHKLNKADCESKFGAKIADKLKYEQSEQDERKKTDVEPEQVAEFWEIWDRAKKRVCFWTQAHDELCYPTDNPSGEPPLDLEGFFPQPAPLGMIKDSSSLEPLPLWNQYCEQASELDRISARINHIVDRMRLRGIYDGKLSELRTLFDRTGDDGDLVPIENAAMWSQSGGLDKAISWVPIKDLVAVLQGLYLARTECLQVIYEITGMSDIIRGQSDASETLGAQQLKANYGGQRIKRMQQAVQRYVRDHIRLMAEVIGNKFQQQTLMAMTGLKLPTQQEKQLAMQQMQQQAMLAQQQQMGQPGLPPQVPQQPPPQPDPKIQQMLDTPSWEDVMGVLRSDAMRQFKIDVETDSTVAAHMEADMAGLRDVLGGITQFVAGIGPAVQAGAFPIEAAKEIILAVARRTRLGSVVEDALDKMQPPQPQQGDPLEKERIELEREQIGAEKEAAQAKVQQTQVTAQAAQAKSAQDAQIAQQQHAMKMQEMAMEAEFKKAEHQARMRELAVQALVADQQAQTDRQMMGEKADHDRKTMAMKAEQAKAAAKQQANKPRAN